KAALSTQIVSSDCEVGSNCAMPSRSRNSRTRTVVQEFELVSTTARISSEIMPMCSTSSMCAAVQRAAAHPGCGADLTIDPLLRGSYPEPPQIIHHRREETHEDAKQKRTSSTSLVACLRPRRYLCDRSDWTAIGRAARNRMFVLAVGLEIGRRGIDDDECQFLGSHLPLDALADLRELEHAGDEVHVVDIFGRESKLLCCGHPPHAHVVGILA